MSSRFFHTICHEFKGFAHAILGHLLLCFVKFVEFLCQDQYGVLEGWGGVQVEGMVHDLGVREGRLGEKLDGGSN